MQVTSANKLSKSLPTFVNMLVFQGFWETLNKETKNVKNVTATLLFGKLKL